MRYGKGHKEETRRHIVGTAAARFRRDGINAVGIKTLMGDVGLTHGGFYAHFPSRDGLVSAAISEAFAETLGILQGAVANAEPGHELEAFVRTYLSRTHRDRAEHGCAAAALAPEVARGSDEAREQFAKGLESIVALLASLLPGRGTTKQRHDRALAVFGGMIGSLQIARTVRDRDLSDSILQSAQAAALNLANANW